MSRLSRSPDLFRHVTVRRALAAGDRGSSYGLRA